MEGDPVAVGVGEGEGPAEGAVDGCGDNGVAVGGECVVDGLDIGGVEPGRDGVGIDLEMSLGYLLKEASSALRAAMAEVLQTLERDGYVMRPAAAPVGKALPARLTPRGRRSLEKASAAVRAVEVGMLAGMTEAEQSAAFRSLRSMIHSLREGDDGAQDSIGGTAPPSVR